ncbi:MAG: response regulator transcription factor [Candidatus Obscuribacterales bacterium]|nr:response regulator transcription factor [Candidatus Obscuribacterales bacterium]
MPDDNTAMIRILLVEDHLLTRIGLKTVIERAADLCVVGEAEDGEQAIAKAQELKPNLILMDVGMPVMDGIEASKRIKELLPAVEIVMLTSHDSERDIFASLSAGASGYCLKDVAPERLYMAIRSVNAGDLWLDATIASKVLCQYTNDMAKVNASEQVQEFNPQAKETGALAKAQQGLPEPLSARELEVLGLVVEGLSNQEIADRLIISLATAKTHVRNILNKLAVDDRTQAAVHAMRRGLV